MRDRGINKHSWKKEELIAYDNASIAEQDKKGRLIAAENKGKTEGRAEGKVEGKIEGKIEGKMEEKKESIRRCWEEKLSIAVIRKIVNLPEEKIREIISKFEEQAQ